jgi:hypothetical protein
MKYLGFLAVASLVLALAAQAGATSIATESFNSYPLGDLNTQTGGTGWAGAWTAPTSAEVVANTNTAVPPAMYPLTYSYGSYAISGGDRTLQVTGNDNNLAYRTLASSQSGDLWFSYLARWQSGTEGSNKFLAFWFDNVATGNHTGVPNIGLKSNWGAPVSGADKEDFVVRLQDGTGADWAGDVNPPELSGGHFVVGHLYKAGTSSTYNAFEMWVDPGAGDIGILHSQGYIYALDNTGSTTLTSFNMVGIRSANLSGDVILIDQILLGTTLNDVLGGGSDTAPEPLTMAGLGLGLVGLVRYVRKRW